MRIQSSLKNYEVNLVAELPQPHILAEVQSAFFVVDQNVYKLYPQLFAKIPLERLYVFEAVEQNKTIVSALAICEKITNMNAKRNAVLVSYGGGIIQDVTGFVANVMYRGIKWLFVPTTLLSACDSCIGSKTSLNYKSYKNLLGTFYPPDEIFICSEFFNTLTEQDYHSGLGEVVKFNVMTGLSGIENLEKKSPLLLSRDKDIVHEFVETSLRFKKNFIEQDEFDKGIRILLNFAHTFGHAIEVASSYHIPHGSAVAMGMLIANHISVNRNMLSEQLEHRIEKLTLPILTLKVSDEWFDIDCIMQAIRKDKKQINDALTAILLKGDLTLEIIHDLTKNEVSDSISYFLQILKKQV